MTINTKDISIYDNGSSGSNNYSNSYIKKYLEKVVNAKMGVTSVSLPKWKGKYKMSEIGSYDKLALKYKKITAYAEAFRESYKPFRNIKAGMGAEGTVIRGYPDYIWLATARTDYSEYVWQILPDGTIDDDWKTNWAYGIRPAIEY